MDIKELYKECKEVNIILSCNNQINIRWRYILRNKKLSPIAENYFLDLLKTHYDNNITRLKYHLLNQTLDVPRCPYCNEKMHWHKTHGKYCCGNKECKYKKMKDTYISNTGYPNPSYNPEVIEKRKETYSITSASPNYKEIRANKVKETCQERYGVDHVMHVRDFVNKNRAKIRYSYNNIYFDSSYELVFYKYCLDHNINIEREPSDPVIYYYTSNNDKKHRYYPDFKISYLDKTMLVEISSNYTWSTKSYEKKKLIEDNNILVILEDNIIRYFDYCKKINFNLDKYKI